MKVFGRKFIGCTIATMFLGGMFAGGLAIVPAAITATVLSLFGGLIVMIWFAYIGGNVWSGFIKSKHFREELNE